MLRSEISTYSKWKVCFTRKRIYSASATCTVAQLHEMCELLSEELPGYRFSPEPITEGGIKFTAWPGMSSNISQEYKSFRFNVRSFPWLNDDTPGSASFNLFNNSSFIVTLKAFFGAPAFNAAELQAFQTVLQKVIGLPEGFHMTSLSKRLVKNLTKF